jgi:hypothetical protein
MENFYFLTSFFVSRKIICMNQVRKQTPPSEAEMKKEFKLVRQLFKDLKKDKSLPTFGDFFMTCLMLNIGEQVNLKIMYPEAYTKYSRWVAAYNKRILRSQQKGIQKK